MYKLRARCLDPCAIRWLVITLELASGSVAGGEGGKVKTTTMTTATVPPRIGGERRAMETVLCNNNWMAVSFHLDMTPLHIPRPQEDEKEEEGSRARGDGEGRTISAQLRQRK